MYTHVQFFLTPWTVAVCDLMNCGPPGSSVPGILQARILKWLAISYSMGSSWPRDWTHISCIFYIGRWILFHCTTWEALKKSPIPIYLNWICGWGISSIAFIKAPYGEFIKYLIKNNCWYSINSFYKLFYIVVGWRYFLNYFTRPT